MVGPPKYSMLRLPSYDAESKALNAVIETPRHSRNKFDYDPQECLFRVEGVLPEGMPFRRRRLRPVDARRRRRSDRRAGIDGWARISRMPGPRALDRGHSRGADRARRHVGGERSVGRDRGWIARERARPNVRPISASSSSTSSSSFLCSTTSSGERSSRCGGWKGPKAAARLVADAQKKYRAAARKRS